MFNKRPPPPWNFSRKFIHFGGGRLPLSSTNTMHNCVKLKRHYNCPDYGWRDGEARRPPGCGHSNVSSCTSSLKSIHCHCSYTFYATGMDDMTKVRKAIFMFSDLFGMDRFDYQTVVTFFVGKYKSPGTFQVEAARLCKFCKFSPPLDCLTFQSGQGSLIIISNKITWCVAAVKQSYRNVVYHNFTHGFHVANSIYSILKVIQPPNPTPQSPLLRRPRGFSILWRVSRCMLEPSAMTWTTGEHNAGSHN